MFTLLFCSLLIVLSHSFTVPANFKRHDRLNILWNSFSATVVGPSISESFSGTIDYEMREASNVDTSLVMGFLGQLRSFHDGLWTGAPPHSSPLVKDGETIQSLMPHLRNCHVILAQQTLSDGCLGVPIGFASYHLKYSGFGPPLMHMEHLFVDPTRRSQGAGLALMNELASIGKTSHCSHMEWSVHQRNARGVEFYHRIGATSTGNPETSCPDDPTTMNWIPSAWDA